MSKPFIVTFVHFDTDDAPRTRVAIDGQRYEPVSIRSSLKVETVGPFKTKRQAQNYASRYNGYAAETLIQELDHPSEDD